MSAVLSSFQEVLGAANGGTVMAHWLEVLLRLLGATGLGVVVSLLYRSSRLHTERQAGFDQTLVLLAPLIAMVTMAVGSNIAAAFTLVGTLAIVRFRTAIRDSRDTAFVIFSVAGGLAMGSGSVLVAGCGTAVVGAAALVIGRMVPAPSPDRSASLRLVLCPPDAELGPVLDLATSLGATASIVRATVDRKQGVLEARLRLTGIDAARIPELLTRLLELPEIVRATCAAADERRDPDDADADRGVREPREPGA